MNFKIDYKDNYTKGEKSTTYFHNATSKQQVIDTLGLNQPDVEWYELTEIENVL